MPDPSEAAAIGDGAPAETRVRRSLAAILAADIKGYSALMDGNEEETHSRVGAEIDRLARAVEAASGTIISYAGDGLMAAFASAVDAVTCALHIQADAARRAEAVPPHRRIVHRIGINAGEVLSHAGHVGGTAVNIAARLEQMAMPGSIYLSEAVYDQVGQAVAVEFSRIGQPDLKNLREPIGVFAISPAACLAWSGLSRPVADASERLLPIAADPRAPLAVLPVRVPYADPADARLADDVVDDVIRLLNGHRDLLVVVRNATIEVPRTPLDFRRVRRELGVRYVLHGTLRRSRERLRLAAELNEAESGRVIWADRFDDDAADPFVLQDRLSLHVATGALPFLVDWELARAAHKHPDSLTAYDLTLQGADLLQRLEPAEFAAARDRLVQALVRNPAWGPAHVQLAWWHALRVMQGWSADPAQDAAAAQAGAEAALRLDGNDGHALALAGHVRGWLLHDAAGAERLIDRALGLQPGCAWAWSFGALACVAHGDGAAAVRRAGEATRLAPLGGGAGWHQHVAAIACLVARRYTDAVGWGFRAIEGRAPPAGAMAVLIASLGAAGLSEEAKAQAQRLLTMEPDFRIASVATLLRLPAAVQDSIAGALRRAGLPD